MPNDFEGLQTIRIEEEETVVVDGVEHTFKTPYYRTESIEEKQQRLLKEQKLAEERARKERVELEEVMITIKLDEHTRMPILDSYEETLNYTFSNGDPFVLDRYYYRFETDEEMKERIAKDKLGKKSDRGYSWKDLVILEMTYHDDSWDQIIEIRVKSEEYEESVKEDDEYKYPDPNKIKEQFDIEWYDLLWEDYNSDPAEKWKFHIWTKNRVYFTYRGCLLYTSPSPRD